MFKFGFEDDPADHCSTTTPEQTPLPVKITPSQAVPLHSVQHDFVPINSAINLRKSIATVPASLSPQGADIVPGVYEGGFKLWECALDLCHHIASLDFSQKAVLELGAGHAFPAIVAAKQGAEIVHVQDYNEEVLKQVSIPNVSANVDSSQFEFFAGAWQKLPHILQRKYDVILTADTVYASAQIVELAQCMVQILERKGVAYVAAKRYYFGVGGGTAEFVLKVKEEFAKHDMQITAESIKEIRDGVSNVREIVEIRRC